MVWYGRPESRSLLVNGHTMLNTPVLVRSLKLSNIGGTGCRAAETKKIKVPIVLAILCRGFLHKTSGTGCRAAERKKFKVPIVLAGLCRGFSHKSSGTGCRAAETQKIQSPDCTGWLAGWLAGYYYV